MTEEIREKAETLRETIQKAVTSFETETGAAVQSIRIETMEVMNELTQSMTKTGRFNTVVIDVTLDIEVRG